MNKLSVITGFLGAIKNRYMEYQGGRTLEEKLERASKIKNLDGVELCYPADFKNVETLIKLIKEYKLGVSAINFRSRRTGKWWRGSFSSNIEKERKEVVAELKEAMDLSVRLNCNRVTTCPLNEGFDYLFELEYLDAFKYLEETFSEVAEYNPEVRICIEYKLNGPRVRCIFGTAGETLAFCQKLRKENLGVTLDFGHALLARENPAQSACMLAASNKLFYVHINDNDRSWDWDMIPGAYNFWGIIEFFYYLKKLGYNDWFAHDVFPKEINTVETSNVVTSNDIKLMKIAERIDMQKMKELLAAKNPPQTIKYLYSLL